jgi:hypothetical protein
MATNAANARIFGSDNDAVFIAPIGTQLPEGLSTPDGFTDAGWLHDDGITIGGDTNIAKFTGHQGGRTVRTKVTNSSTTFKFQCLETTALTLGLQLNILEKTGDTQTVKARVSSGRKVESRAFAIDVYDEDATTLQYRYAIARGEIGERQEFTLSGSNITGYTFTVEIIGDYWIITNDQAFADIAPGGDTAQGGAPEVVSGEDA